MKTKITIPETSFNKGLSLQGCLLKVQCTPKLVLDRQYQIVSMNSGLTVLSIIAKNVSTAVYIPNTEYETV